MRVTWISGWGVAPESLRPLATKWLSKAEHSFLAPTKAAVLGTGASDAVVAWSLGACEVLHAAACGLRFRGTVCLLAPFLAFCSESGQGGRCTRTQVRWLRRWLERDPRAALTDFYTRAGLQFPLSLPPYEMEDLLEGLDCLVSDAPEHLVDYAGRLPNNWSAVVGDSDPLLDAVQVTASIRGCKVLRGVGHAPQHMLSEIESLLDAL